MFAPKIKIGRLPCLALRELRPCQARSRGPPFFPFITVILHTECGAATVGRQQCYYRTMMTLLPYVMKGMQMGYGDATNGGEGCYKLCSVLLPSGSRFEDFWVIFYIPIFSFLQSFYDFTTIIQNYYCKMSSMGVSDKVGLL
jgi:hypothetical protein